MFLKDSPVFVDIETYSKVNLKECGTYNYGSHPSTEIVCLCFIYDNQVYLTSGNKLEGALKELEDLTIKAPLVAHNALFEYLVLSKYINLSLDDFNCSMLLSRYNGGPLSLNNCSYFWKLKNYKKEGKDLIKEYHNIFDNNGDREDYYNSERYKKLADYCLKDVEVMKELWEKIHSLRSPLSEREKTYWLDTHTINSIGVPINLKKTQRILDLYIEYKTKIKDSFYSLYKFNPNSPFQTTKFLKNKGNLIQVLKRDKLTNTYKLKDTTESPIVNANWNKLSEDVKKMFNFKWCFPSSQIKRLERINNLIKDGRIEGLLRHFGASTGRYTSSIFNILNLPRSGDKIIKDSDTLETYKWKTGKILLNSLRSVIEGNETYLIISDLSQIEFRLLMYFCGRDDILKKLNNGQDIYLDFAEDLFNFRPKKDSIERHIAKTGTLQLGYGSSPGQFRTTLSKDFKNVSLDLCYKLYNLYHKRYPEVSELHSKFSTFLNYGLECRKKRFSLLEDYILLPSNRKIYVRDIDTDIGENKYSYIDGKTPYKVPAHTAVSWLCQGTARDIIFYKQSQALSRGLDVIFNEYDKLVVETEAYQLDKHKSILSDIMMESLDFLPDLTIQSDTQIVKHYK